MAKELMNFQLRIDVDALANTKILAFCAGAARDSVATSYQAGVSCPDARRALTAEELAGTLADFLAAHKAMLEAAM